jgi:hypothetical protein
MVHDGIAGHRHFDRLLLSGCSHRGSCMRRPERPEATTVCAKGDPAQALLAFRPQLDVPRFGGHLRQFIPEQSRYLPCRRPDCYRESARIPGDEGKSRNSQNVVGGTERRKKACNHSRWSLFQHDHDADGRLRGLRGGERRSERSCHFSTRQQWVPTAMRFSAGSITHGDLVDRYGRRRRRVAFLPRTLPPHSTPPLRHKENQRKHDRQRAKEKSTQERRPETPARVMSD